MTELCTGGELFDRIVEKTKESDDSNLSCFSEHDAAKMICKIFGCSRILSRREGDCPSRSEAGKCPF